MKFFEHLALLKSINGLGIAGINKNYYGLITMYPDYDDFKEWLMDSGTVSGSDVQKAKLIINSTHDELEQNDQVKLITCYDDEYPSRFNLLGNQSPLYFFAAGDTSILNEETVAVIGTRKPSIYGINACKRIIAEIPNSVIVSGLALGTDRAAHESAIGNSLKTLAVLPSGFGNITPSSNKPLAGMIADGNGCLITEYDFDDKPEKYTYLRRDSLVAAISDAIVVIECGVKSGTMHTVEAAIKMNKPIACYYTDRDGDYSGNKKLLDAGEAVRIMKPEDIRTILETSRK